MKKRPSGHLDPKHTLAFGQSEAARSFDRVIDAVAPKGGANIGLAPQQLQVIREQPEAPLAENDDLWAAVPTYALIELLEECRGVPIEQAFGEDFADLKAQAMKEKAEILSRG